MKNAYVGIHKYITYAYNKSLHALIKDLKIFFYKGSKPDFTSYGNFVIYIYIVYISVRMCIFDFLPYISTTFFTADGSVDTYYIIIATCQHHIVLYKYLSILYRYNMYTRYIPTIGIYHTACAVMKIIIYLYRNAAQPVGRVNYQFPLEFR